MNISLNIFKPIFDLVDKIGLLVLFEAVEGYVDLLKKGQKTLEDMKRKS